MADWFYGFDVSTRAVSIAWVPDEKPTALTSMGATTIDFPDSRGRDARRLSIIRERIFANVQRVAQEVPPCFCWIEQASGRFVAPSLVYAVGIVQEAAYTALRDLYAHPVHVETVPSGTWKKAALGNGAAKKGDVMRWAHERGFLSESQDECDALAIAEAARKSVRFGAHDRAA